MLYVEGKRLFQKLPVTFLLFVDLLYNMKAARKKTDDNVSALPTTPVTCNENNFLKKSY